MEDKGVIPLGLGRNSALEATELIVPRLLMAPFIQRKRRVGGHDIEAHQLAIFIEQLGVADGVAPLDLVVVFPVQEHVHLGQRPGRTDGLLPVEGVVLLAMVFHHLATALHQQ
ncbi:hypothetical protein D3C86_1322980 [compost metagenome]